MKRFTIVFLLLALSSLACVQSAVISSPGAAVATRGPGEDIEAPAGAVYEMPVITSTAKVYICIEVIAEESLHLREGPNASAKVLTWLYYGDVLRVISRNDSTWWLVTDGSIVGYINSNYTKESECE